MPSFIVNDTSQLLQVDMTGSVGRNGTNNVPDVRLVQQMLNVASSSDVGVLKVDGLVGPRTIGAIEAFQKETLGFSDGRVDVGGRTIQALVRALQSLTNAPSIEGVRSPRNDVAVSLSDSGSRLFGFRRPSSWKLTSTEGFSGGIGPASVANGSLFVEEDREPFGRLRLDFSAVGFGLSVLPFGIEQASRDLPTRLAGRVFMGSLFFKDNLSKEDFLGGIQIVSASANTGMGAASNITSVGWGPKGGKASADIVGDVAGTPNAGISLLFGTVHAVF